MKLISPMTSQRFSMVEATVADIDCIIEMEHHPDNRDYIWQGTREEHLAEIDDDAHLLLIFRRPDGAPIGYSLSRIDAKSEVYELRRIVITEKGKGYGREAMMAHFKYAFEVLGINRFWLDVFPDNIIGRRLYESMGMHCEGILRQAYKSERGYLDQIILSMLRDEYFAMKPR